MRNASPQVLGWGVGTVSSQDSWSPRERDSGLSGFKPRAGKHKVCDGDITAATVSSSGLYLRAPTKERIRRKIA